MSRVHALRFPLGWVCGLLMAATVGCQHKPAAQPSAEAPAPEHTPAGRSYKLSLLSGQSLIPETAITLQFKDQQATGSAGANRYFASARFTAAAAGFDGGVVFGPAGSTRMLVLEPKGLMEQEAAYLEALGKADQFRWGLDAQMMLGSTQDPELLLVFEDTGPAR